MEKLELWEKELEMKYEEMQLQLKLKKLELQKVATLTAWPEALPTTTTSFDVSQKVWLVPQFTEQEVDKFFLHFEKVAANLHWPSETHNAVAICSQSKGM